MNIQIKLLGMIALAAVFALKANPVSAQKNKDTLRLAQRDSVGVIDPITNAAPASDVLQRAIIGSLVTYDWDAKKYVPSHATAWRMIDDKTLEYDLREDITFHDGTKFDADDVVNSFNYIVQPSINFAYKSSFVNGLDRAEKLGKYKLRFHATELLSSIIYQTGERFRVVPAGKFVGNKDDFGKAPIGSGPYQVVQIDGTRGVALKKFDGFRLSSTSLPAAKIGRVEVNFIADPQTQLANLLTGNIDFMTDIDPDIAEELIQNPKLQVDTVRTLGLTYMGFDVTGRSGVNFFKDQRVRQAVSMAIDRAKLGTLLVLKNGEKLDPLDNLCVPGVYLCAGSPTLPEFNPAKAKELLAEAGYKDGFDLKISSFGPSKSLATAVAGSLRAIGIRAEVEYLTTTAFLKTRADGRMQSIVSYYSNGSGQSDGSATVDFFFAAGGRDYAQDPIMHELVSQSLTAMNPEQRSGIYAKLYERAINNNYFLPLVPLPTLIAHHKDVVVEYGPRNGAGYQYNYLRWSN